MKSSDPIGVFDSGIGGLTVVKSIKKLLPSESIIYVGDTEHFPYGDKSEEDIYKYRNRILNFLIQQRVKAIVIACHSASTLPVSKDTKDILGPTPLFDVINPTIEYIISNYKDSKVGLIGTKITVSSNVYQDRLMNSMKGEFKPISTPLLAPMVEGGITDNHISKTILEYYFEQANLIGIDALVLGCTHYKVLKKQIIEIIGKDITLIDPGKLCALKLRQALTENNLISEEKSYSDVFYSTHTAPEFEKLTKLFFGEILDIKTLSF